MKKKEKNSGFKQYKKNVLVWDLLGMDTGEMRGLETAWGFVLDFLLIIHVTLDIH